MKRIVSFVLALALLALTAVNVSAADTASKEEVVYGILGADGGVGSVYVVNILDGGSAEDFGSYTEVLNMTTSDSISVDGDHITVKTDAKKLYYQGRLKNSELPWIIDIRYTIDGKEVSGGELGGMSGRLRIDISITKNPRVNEHFYSSYALQTTLTLDTEICRDIKTGGGTEALVGKNKNITFTKLPGRDAKYVIEADVTGFTMPAITINGILLDLNLDFDTDELVERFSELKDGALSLGDGALELKDGAFNLKNGASKLNSGVKELQGTADKLKNGTNELMSGTEELRNGILRLSSGAGALQGGAAQLSGGLAELSSKTGELTGGSAAILAAIAKIEAGVNGISPASVDELVGASVSFQSSIAYLSGLASGVSGGLTAMMGELSALSDASVNAVLTRYSTLPTQMGTLNGGLQTLNSNFTVFNTKVAGLKAAISGLSGLSAGVAELSASYARFHGSLGEYAGAVYKISAGYADVYAGITELQGGIRSVQSGADALYAGAGGLKSGTVSLSEGVRELTGGSAELLSGSGRLYNGTLALADGTDTLTGKTGNIDSDIKAELEGRLGELSPGEDFVVRSFVSEKNKNVERVQFVLKTEVVTLPEEAVPVTVEPEKLTVWQKFLHLFGI